MDATKQTLIDAALTLLTEHNIKQTQIFDWVREAFVKHAETLPKISVLYCDTYGGFSYSDEFQMYLGENYIKNPTLIINYRERNERTCYVDYIKPFGEMILNKYPELKNIIYIYEFYNVKNLINNAKQIVKLEKDIKRYEINTTLLQEYLDSPNSKYAKDEWSGKPDSWLMLSLKPQFIYYHKTDLVEMLEEYKSGIPKAALLKEINDKRQSILDIVKKEKMVDNIIEFVVNLEIAKTQKQMRSSFDREKSSFVKCLDVLGFEDPETWKRQSYYNEDAILYILHKKGFDPHQNMYDYFVNDSYFIRPYDLFDNTIYLKFGLMCASGLYCKIAIAEVPALVDWEIGEYDGLENVYVK